MWQIFEQIGDEFLRAVAADLEALAANPQLYRDLSASVSQVLGLDVTRGLVKPYWDEAYCKGAELVKELVEVAGEDPDETAELIKEKSAGFADSFAAALKKRKENKRMENNVQ